MRSRFEAEERVLVETAGGGFWGGRRGFLEKRESGLAKLVGDGFEYCVGVEPVESLAWSFGNVTACKVKQHRRSRHVTKIMIVMDGSVKRYYYEKGS
jgi:hypothetical protein